MCSSSLSSVEHVAERNPLDSIGTILYRTPTWAYPDPGKMGRLSLRPTSSNSQSYPDSTAASYPNLRADQTPRLYRRVRFRHQSGRGPGQRRPPCKRTCCVRPWASWKKLGGRRSSSLGCISCCTIPSVRCRTGWNLARLWHHLTRSQLYHSWCLAQVATKAFMSPSLTEHETEDTSTFVCGDCVWGSGSGV